MKRTLTAAVGIAHRVDSAHSPIKLGTVMLPIFTINVTNHGGSFVTFEAEPGPLYFKPLSSGLSTEPHRAQLFSLPDGG